MKHKNEVIILGGNHHNTLGVIRVFGEKGMLSNVIITNKHKYCYISKSKYIKEYDIIFESEKDILELLEKKYSNKKNKPVLIPTSDFCALVLDKNKNKLEKNYIIPSINNKENLIVEYMDKYKQYEFIKECNIKIAKSWELNIEKAIIPVDIIYPCIIKPLISAYAAKSDITICRDLEELKTAITKYEKLNYTDAILQEYIEFEQEYGLIGCSHNKKVILPGIIKKERIFPKGRGNVSFGKIDKIENSKINFKPIINLLKKINYSGMFDIEVFIKNNDFYLNEINFRNSGNSYLYTYENVYIVYLWYLMASNQSYSDEITEIKQAFFFTDEILEIKQLKSKNISMKEWIIAHKKSKISFLINKKDTKPVIYKFIYAVFRRIKNG